MTGKKTIKAIPTKYAGCFFRSRLEARWAIYFDAIGWGWNYEVEGFELDGGVRYLPDFWFPRFDLYAEVKREGAPDTEFAKAEAFARAGKSILLLSGPPKRRAYPLLEGRPNAEAHRTGGVLVPSTWKYGPVYIGGSLERGEWRLYDRVTQVACNLATESSFEFNKTPDHLEIRAVAEQWGEA